LAHHPFGSQSEYKSCGTQIEASHILVSIEVSEASKAKIEENAQEAQKQLKKKSIDDVAKSLEMEPRDSDWVNHDAQFIPGLGQNPQMIAWMIKAKKGHVSELMRDQQGNLVIAKMTDNVKTYYEDFEKVKARIRYELEKTQKIAQAKVKADEFAANTPVISISQKRKKKAGRYLI
jgi:hypothetical protein